MRAMKKGAVRDTRGSVLKGSQRRLALPHKGSWYCMLLTHVVPCMKRATQPQERLRE